MFTVPQKHRTVKPHKDRGARIYSLHKQGMSMRKIAKDSEVVDMSGGYVLTAERVRQIIEREKQKTTD
jgi:hypothetical protein